MIKNDLRWTVLSLVAALCAVAIVITAAFIGGCQGMIETAACTQVPMKCHWAMRAVAMTAIVPLAAGILEIFIKDVVGRRTMSVLLIICGVVVFMLTTNIGIGVCAADAMMCAKSALCIKTAASALAIVAIIQLVYATGRKDKPKRGF